ncbi:hybrid sensor histidine kinase/response regulator transcription factor [Siphonobacter aquaeclarae]|uniref:histidine kinase n=1 Tax=Siphonobacter aquaeclarae TaxID=563176 RepID=A0A1G9ITH2_9BACT|nr:two-component regulator propeller domain-containing protein [Siphonobacter aquaeclarae]SDL28375.1 Signal transduction histidine kinase [Siphonobacter aquaeclarae]
MNWRKILLVLVSVAWLELTGYGFALGYGRISFRRIGLTDGLKQTAISAIAQDKQGFMWIGTWKGLLLYDGYEFKEMALPYARGSKRPDDHITHLTVDSKNRVWIATYQDLYLYDPLVNQIRRVLLKGKDRLLITSVFEDRNGYVFLVTPVVLYRIDGFFHHRTIPVKAGIGLPRINCALQDVSGRVWLGTNKGVWCFESSSSRFWPLVVKAGTLEEKITAIGKDSRGNLWLGSEKKGVLKWDATSGKVIRYQVTNSPLPSNWIRRILTEGDHVWIGTRDGLSVVHVTDGSFTNYVHHSEDPTSLSDNKVWSLFQDRDSGIWVGTFSRGLNLFHPVNARFLNLQARVGNGPGLRYPIVHALLEDRKGYWAGTFGGGLNFIDSTFSKIDDYDLKKGANTFSNEVKTIVMGPDQSIWAGTTNGLIALDKTRRPFGARLLELGKESGGAGLINILLVEDRGIWVGTSNLGLIFLQTNGTRNKNDFAERRTAVTSNITSLLEAGANGLLVGTTEGLFHYDKAENRIIRKIPIKGTTDLTDAWISTLYRDSRRRIWIGTERDGLFYYDTLSGNCFGLQDAISDKVIHTVLEESLNGYWVSTDDGIFNLRFRRFLPPFAPEDREVRHYSIRDGLASNQFLSNSGLRDRKGRLLFGGMNGILVFNPATLQPDRQARRVVLTAILANNQPVQGEENLSGEIDRIRLSYQQSHVSIRFSSLTYRDISGTRYCYRLIGNGGYEEWIPTTANAVTFHGLQPGEYLFEVTTVTPNGKRSDQIRKLIIRITPPFWKTGWAYGLYVLLTGLLVFLIVRYFTTRASLVQQQRAYQSKVDFFTNISHEIRTPLSLMVGPLDNALSATTGQGTVTRNLLLVRENTNRLLRLINELLDFRKMEEGKMKLYLSVSDIIALAEEVFVSFEHLAVEKDIRYHFLHQDAAVCCDFDRQKMEKVFFNLLSNAIKFTPRGGEITLAVNREKISDGRFAVNIEVGNTGEGVSENNLRRVFHNFFQTDIVAETGQGTGIGLSYTRSIVLLHGGSISVSSRQKNLESEGYTSFQVSIPVSDAALGLSGEVAPPGKTAVLPGELFRTKHSTENKAGLGKGKYRILVVEDHQELREYLLETFSQEYIVSGAMDGTSGFDYATREIPDLIISDLIMPGENGLEFCRRIKRDTRTNHIPFLLLTASTIYSHQLHGFENGADAYITKPFTPDLLLLQVRNILASRDLIRKKNFADILSPSGDRDPAPSADSVFLKKLIDFIEANIGNPAINVDMIAREMLMSRTVLYRKVAALTDSSILDLVKIARLKKAESLLKISGKTISEIAYEVGFNDNKYFSKEFKKFFHINPSDYAAANRPRREQKNNM